jgi:hypothetical protein
MSFLKTYEMTKIKHQAKQILVEKILVQKEKMPAMMH